MEKGIWLTEQSIAGIMMKQREKIDYLFFTSERKSAKKVDFFERELAGIRMLQVKICVKEMKKKETEQPSPFSENMVKKIKRGLKHYDITQSVIGADEKMSEALQLEEVMFQARKRELLKYRKFVLEQLKRVGGCKRGRRSSILIVLDSRRWNYKDVLSILVTAKDYIGMEKLKQTLYDEWGIVLRVMSKANAIVERMDFVLFLLRDWSLAQISQYQFAAGYVVLDIEKDGMTGKRVKRLGAGKAGEKGYICSGLAYERLGKCLPYPLAINIAWQNAALYEEFDISAVAIYQIEW